MGTSPSKQQPGTSPSKQQPGTSPSKQKSRWFWQTEATTQSTRSLHLTSSPNRVKPLSKTKNCPPRPSRSICSASTTKLNRPPPEVTEEYQTDRLQTAATITKTNEFPPLENIGRYQTGRPWTAGSTKTSKVGFSGSIEPGRPATSHAANRGAKASNVSPAPADFKCRQATSSARPAYSPKPKHLDDSHPALRGVRQDHDSPPPPYHKVPPQLGTNDQQGAINTSVIPAPGPKSSLPPPLPLPSQAKHSPSPPTVSSATSSPPRRDGQQRQCTYDYQRRAASTTDCPIQGQEPYEPPRPPLPPRPRTTESSGSSGSSTKAGTLATSRRSSNASTIFTDIDPGTAIATPEFDFSSLLVAGRTFGVGQLNFDWEPDDEADRFAERCEKELEGDEQLRRIGAIQLLQAGRPFGRTTVEDHAQRAWTFLSPDDSKLRIGRITPSFCKYFYHVWDALQRGKMIPYQVPVEIRARFVQEYHTVWKKVEEAKSPRNRKLANWISSLDGEEQGVRLIALLEVIMDTEGPMGSHNTLRAVVRSIGQVQTLKHVTDNQISNYFATYVRVFRARLSQIRLGDEAALAASLDHFSAFWRLCTFQYSNSIAGNSLFLFKLTISKLDNIDIPLCLWIFLAGSGVSSRAQNMGSPEVKDLYEAMESELNVRLPGQCPTIVSVFMTVQFLLSAGHYGFFEILHSLMLAQKGAREWQHIWRTCRRSDLYTALREDTEQEIETFEKMLSEALRSF